MIHQHVSGVSVSVVSVHITFLSIQFKFMWCYHVIYYSIIIKHDNKLNHINLNEKIYLQLKSAPTEIIIP